jgi:ribosomal protein S18 acetylase RimI-like enzyme
VIEIKQLGIEHYAALCEVWQASGVHFRPTGRESRESFQAQMASGQQTAIGAWDDDRLVGVTLATHDGRKGWINRLGVLPAYQRQGIGRALINEADRVLHEQGMTMVAALVEKWNEASLGLFKSAGFRVEEVYYLTRRDSPDV